MLKRIGIPGWSTEVNDKFILKQWLKTEGQEVKKGDEIAIISRSNGTTETIISPVNGELKHLAKEGGGNLQLRKPRTCYRTRGAYFGPDKNINEPVVITHPNGDPQQKAIPFIVVWLVIGAAFFTLRMGFINIRASGIPLIWQEVNMMTPMHQGK